ncbi:helix-turn-helix transcriptional regulator [Moheibacter stercoris]|uniref:Transcriptional regulator with XRE-family HTH domain n=1 Tax=Moheibacter stercoris TaxID=1628251 RepID=A0ABV2LTB2_9FLAO
MDVKNRIIEILEKSGLTPSEFADKIDVQRSAISHITSGRNKPSLEFLIKIKQAFPEIDTDWLVFGIEKEEISEEILPEKEIQETSTSSFPTLFDSIEEGSKLEISSENNSNESLNESQKLDSEISTERKLIKTLLFYSDGSFEEFNPID